MRLNYSENDPFAYCTLDFSRSRLFGTMRRHALPECKTNQFIQASSVLSFLQQTSHISKSEVTRNEVQSKLLFGISLDDPGREFSDGADDSR
jgi:hypothetical protein